MRLIGCLLIAAFFLTAPAAAQAPPVVSLADPDPARWETAFSVGWRATNGRDVTPDWNSWLDAGSFGASAGYYWTPRLKAELEVAATTEAEVFVSPVFPSPSGGTVYRFGEYRARTSSVSASLVHQFGQNAWVHPFVGEDGPQVRADEAALGDMDF